MTQATQRDAYLFFQQGQALFKVVNFVREMFQNILVAHNPTETIGCLADIVLRGDILVLRKAMAHFTTVLVQVVC